MKNAFLTTRCGRMMQSGLPEVLAGKKKYQAQFIFDDDTMLSEKLEIK